MEREEIMRPDGGVVNCGWVRKGLWDLTSWLRPTVARAARQLNLELSALRWSVWDGVGNLEPRVWEPGLWRFSVDVSGPP